MSYRFISSIQAVLVSSASAENGSIKFQVPSTTILKDTYRHSELTTEELATNDPFGKARRS